MQVFARRSLVPQDWRDDEPALLLEGDWPNALEQEDRDSLDASIDAQQLWIDDAAQRIAHQLGEGHARAVLAGGELPCGLLAHLSGLRLRYFLVKLLRWAAYCRDVRRPMPGERWTLYVGTDDADYVDVFWELCECYGMRGEVKQCSPHNASVRDANGHPNSTGGWGRMYSFAPRAISIGAKTIAHRLLRWGRASTLDPSHPRFSLSNEFGKRHTERAIERATHTSRRSRRRLLLGGNLALLSPLAATWHERGSEVAGLCDEAILRLRIRQPYLRQLCCQGSRGTEYGLESVRALDVFTEEGINLGPALTRWLTATRETDGPRWSRWLAAIDRHMACWRPDALVLSEDATPFTRAAVWCARRHGVPSVVAQHGAPCLQFGFAPLVADWMAAWDEASREQFLDWGMPAERVVVTGSLSLDKSRTEVRKLKQRHKRDARTVLLLANLPARDDRPDGVAYHLTRNSHENMLRAALAACASIPGLQVLVKLHPRQAGNAPWPALLAEFPELPVRLLTAGRWIDFLGQSQAVLSCASSAGIEAARLGWPVVQLLPEGSAEVLTARRWGLLGSVTTAEELGPLLHEALHTRIRPLPGAMPKECSAATLLANFVDRVIETARTVNCTNIQAEESLCLPT